VQDCPEGAQLVPPPPPVPVLVWHVPDRQLSPLQQSAFDVQPTASAAQDARQ
jgi:hypothetical protein